MLKKILFLPTEKSLFTILKMTFDLHDVDTVPVSGNPSSTSVILLLYFVYVPFIVSYTCLVHSLLLFDVKIFNKSLSLIKEKKNLIELLFDGSELGFFLVKRTI